MFKFKIPEEELVSQEPKGKSPRRDFGEDEFDKSDALAQAQEILDDQKNQNDSLPEDIENKYVPPTEEQKEYMRLHD